MKKNYVEVDGVKYYAKDGEEAAENQEAAAGTEGEESEGTDAAEGEGSAPSSEEVQKTAKNLAASISKELGLDDLRKTMNRVEDSLNDPVNAKLKSLLHGKDMIKDKDQLTKEEKIVGFFHACVTNNVRAIKALSEGVAADGGNLFPTEFVSELIKPLTIPTRARSIVTVRTMRRNTLTIPARGNTVKVYWTAENAAKTTTTAQWNQVTLTARKAAAIIYASDELIEDSTEIDVVSEIIEQFANAIGDAEDYAILRGNGTTQPTGIETARAAGTFASVAAGVDMNFDDIVDLTYALKPQYRSGAAFLIHPNTSKMLRKIKDTTGRYIWMDSVSAGLPPTLMGYPVYEFYDLPTSVTYFGNWKQAYWLGDRKQMTVKISQDANQAFTQDETAIRVVMRIGGNIVLAEAAKAVTHAAT